MSKAAPAALAAKFVSLRWAKTSPEERKALGRKLAEARAEAARRRDEQRRQEEEVDQQQAG